MKKGKKMVVATIADAKAGKVGAKAEKQVKSVKRGTSDGYMSSGKC